jgi:hypothetical protein
VSDREVIVHQIPQCNFCTAPAYADGKTYRGPWAYMCRAHFELHGIGLGLGLGQRLVTK